MAVGADAIPGEELCHQAITRIRITGNRVTKEHVLQNELAQELNSPCSIDNIVDSIQAIMDLGLFTSVRAELHSITEGVELHLAVKEKYFFVAIPRISRTSNAELRMGFQLRWDNFLGRMHTLRITSEQRKENDGNGPGGYVHSMVYNVPRFFGSKQGLALSLAIDSRLKALSLDGTVLGMAFSESRLLGVQVSHWLNRSKGIHGMRLFAGLNYEQRSLTLEEGELGSFVGGTDIALSAGFEQRQVHQEVFRRRGQVYGAMVRFAGEASGSDFSYYAFDLYAMSYIPIKGGIRNLNVKARLGISNGAPFGGYAYHIGGGEELRGMEKGHISGDVQALVNVEYLSAFFKRPEWRWLLFTDLGNVYKQGDINLFKQHLRAGLGLRWKILRLTNTDLRADIAWDSKREKVETYVSTNLTF